MSKVTQGNAAPLPDETAGGSCIRSANDKRAGRVGHRAALDASSTGRGRLPTSNAASTRAGKRDLVGSKEQAIGSAVTDCAGLSGWDAIVGAMARTLSRTALRNTDREPRQVGPNRLRNVSTYVTAVLPGSTSRERRSSSKECQAVPPVQWLNPLD